MSKKMKIINYGIIAISALVLVYFVFFVDGAESFIVVMKKANIGWLVVAGLCMVAYWILESFGLHIVAKKLFNVQKFVNTLRTSMIGQLFNCITPFASGGQPIQAYHMVKCGMPVGLASSALLCKFIIYQSVLTLYSLVVLLFKYKFFAVEVNKFSVLVLTGFIINTLVVIMLLCIAIFPTFVKKVASIFMLSLSKLRLVKEYEKKMEKINLEIDAFYISFVLLRKNFKMLFQMILVTTLQLTCFFSIPFFICLSLRMVNVSPLSIIAAGAFVLMVTSFVPLPGAAGGAEGTFYLFFGMFFEQSGLLVIAILIWRILTFYFPIIVGAFFTKNIVCHTPNRT